MICDLCHEPITEDDYRAPVRPLVAHAECSLRSVAGGIGHHLNHEYWCLQMHDPDAGLTYRESARRIWQLFSVNQ